MSLQVAYRRFVGLIAFKGIQNPFVVFCVADHRARAKRAKLPDTCSSHVSWRFLGLARWRKGS
jgi:hypothetical protein